MAEAAQFNPYPLLFVRNKGFSTVTATVKTPTGPVTLSVDPGKVSKLHYLIAKLDGFQRVWTAGGVEVSATEDFASLLTEVPPLVSGGGGGIYIDTDGTPYFQA